MARIGTTIFEFDHPDGTGPPVQLEITNEQMDAALGIGPLPRKVKSARQVQSFIELRYGMRVRPKPPQAVRWSWLATHWQVVGPGNEINRLRSGRKRKSA